MGVANLFQLPKKIVNRLHLLTLVTILDMILSLFMLISAFNFFLKSGNG